MRKPSFLLCVKYPRYEWNIIRENRWADGVSSLILNTLVFLSGKPPLLKVVGVRHLFIIANTFCAYFFVPAILTAHLGFICLKAPLPIFFTFYFNIAQLFIFIKCFLSNIFYIFTYNCLF